MCYYYPSSEEITNSQEASSSFEKNENAASAFPRASYSTLASLASPLETTPIHKMAGIKTSKIPSQLKKLIDEQNPSYYLQKELHKNIQNYTPSQWNLLIYAAEKKLSWDYIITFKEYIFDRVPQINEEGSKILKELVDITCHNYTASIQSLINFIYQKIIYNPDDIIWLSLQAIEYKDTRYGPNYQKIMDQYKKHQKASGTSFPAK